MLGERLLLPLLLVALAGCAAVTTKEHRLAGAAPSVTVKAFWRDPQGERFLVGGVDCELEGAAGALPRRRTTVGEPLVFNDLLPGRYRLRVSGHLAPRSFTHAFELPPRRRVTLRVDLQAVARHGGPGAAEGALHVLKEGGIVVLAGVTFGVFWLVNASLEDDEPGEEPPWKWEVAPDDERPDHYHEWNPDEQR